MKSPFASLIGLTLKASYSPGGGSTSISPARRTARNVGIGILIAVIAADFLFMFGFYYLSAYQALKPLGAQSAILALGAIAASMLIFIMGFLMAISTYCPTSAETLFLALPLKPRQILGAKFISSYASQLVGSLLIMGMAVIIYGVREVSGPLFYLAGLLVCLALPLLPLALDYLIIIPVMRVAKPLRNKNVVMFIASGAALVLALGFSFFTQSASTKMENPAWIQQQLAGPDALVTKTTGAYFPAGLAWRALGGSTAGTGQNAARVSLGASALALLALFAVSLAAAVLVVSALAGIYSDSLAGFDEKLLKRHKASAGEMDRTYRQKPIVLSLLEREIKLVNREPTYFFNGPFTVIIMPLVLGITWFAQKDELGAAFSGPGFAGFASGPGGMLAAAGLAAFSGALASVTATAFSRDAKALTYLKAMPLDARSYATAKWLHGYSISVLADVVSVVFAAFALKLDAAAVLGALFISLAFNAFTNLLGLLLDASNPRLHWDTTTAAMKQNPNMGIMVFGIMIIVGAFAVLSFTLKLSRLGFVLAYGLGFAALFCISLPFARRAIDRRVEEMEV